MTGVSKTLHLILVVFAWFLALTAKHLQMNDHQNQQELTMKQSKTTLFRNRNLKGLVFLSADLSTGEAQSEHLDSRPSKKIVCASHNKPLDRCLGIDQQCHIEVFLGTPAPHASEEEL